MTRAQKLDIIPFSKEKRYKARSCNATAVKVLLR